jgi:hypothetical protein
MKTDNTIEMLKGLIEEVKRESKAGVIKENKETAPVQDENKMLKEYVTKNVMNILRESGD